MINYSIIIPHFNIPELLARCLRSIPERDDVQVIVVDDNSPHQETYLETIPELSRKNVEFYPTKDGLGAGHVRNIGLSHAKGKWLMFSDSDDFFVEDIGDILDQYVNDTHDIIYFNIKSCDCYDTTKLLNASRDSLFNFCEEKQDYSAFRVCYTEPWGKIIRHSLIKDNGIKFQETKAHNDLLFSIKAGVLAKSILAVDRPLYWYVFREGSLGHHKGMEPEEKIQDRIRAWLSAQQFLEAHGARVKVYLPVMPCLKVFAHDKKLYFRLLKFMKDNGMSQVRVVYETIKYSVKRVFTGEKAIDIKSQIELSKDNSLK